MKRKRIIKWLGITAGIMLCTFTQQVIFADEIEETVIEEEIITEEESVLQNAEVEAGNPSVEYCSYVADIGWQDPVSDGDVAGTTGKGLAMEAIEIELSDSSLEGDIQYRVLTSNDGWQDSVNNGEMAGTTGNAQPLEAVQIWLNGQINEYYDIYYQPHVSNVGWLGWAKNGQKAGSQGYGCSLEALKIQLLEKGQQLESEQDAFLVNQVQIQAHVSNIGWMEPVKEEEIAGTTGLSQSVEAIRINLNDPAYSGNVEYRAYVSGIGWQGMVSDGETAGTVGQAKPIEAVQIALTGEISNYYDIYYQTHVSNLGWLGWAKNGEAAGTIEYGSNLEALVIQLVEKGNPGPSSSVKPLYYNRLTGQAHVSNIGWMRSVKENEMLGTTGQGLAMEAFWLRVNDLTYSGDVEYKAYVSGIGWQDIRSHGEMTGTVGQAKPIEAVKIALTGEISNYYNIYYQTHVSNLGWLGWAKNGEAAGTIANGCNLEALSIQLIEKGKAGPSASVEPLYYDRLTGQAHVSNIGWMEFVKENEIMGTTGQGLAMEAFWLRVNDLTYSGDIQYTAYVSGIGWQDLVSHGEMAGTVGQVKPIEAVKIALIGELADHYDIYYQTHVSNMGWLGWGKNGEAAGTIAYGCNLEALTIQLVEKGGQGPTSPLKPLYQNRLTEQVYVSNIGWQDLVREGETAGTERGFSIEAFRLSLGDVGYSGGLEYRSHIADIGWENEWKTNSDISGTAGQSHAVQAIQIRLNGDVSNYYDIAYRTYVFEMGWMKWTLNGLTSGTEGMNLPIQAIQVRLLEKNTGIEDENTVTNLNGITGYQDGNILSGWQKIGTSDYYFDTAGSMVTNQMVDGRYLGTGGKAVDFYSLSDNLKNYLYEAAYAGEDWAVSIIFKDEILDIYSHQMQSASVMKLFVMGTIYDNYEEMIQLYGQDVIDSNLYAMITVSDNDAWKQLRAFLGYGDEEAGCQRINAWAGSQGYYDTYNSAAAYQNYTSTHDSAKIIYDMYNHRFACSELMLSLLQQQTRTWKIPAGIPAGVPTGNKTGELDNCENDAAIIWAPYGTFTLSVMSYNVQNTAYAQAMIRQIASAVYDWLSVY